MELTGKQKRHLRSRGQELPATLTVGKAGATEAVVAQLRHLLEKRELVKVRLPAMPPEGRQALAEQLARAAGAACAGTLGRTALLHRPNPDLPPGKHVTP